MGLFYHNGYNGECEEFDWYYTLTDSSNNNGSLYGLTTTQIKVIKMLIKKFQELNKFRQNENHT